VVQYRIDSEKIQKSIKHIELMNHKKIDETEEETIPVLKLYLKGYLRIIDIL
jgi:hypothetical protein